MRYFIIPGITVAAVDLHHNSKTSLQERESVVDG